MLSAEPPQNCPALPLQGVLQPSLTPNFIAVGSELPNQQRLPCSQSVRQGCSGPLP